MNALNPSHASLIAEVTALKLHIDQQTNAGIELRRIVRAMLDDCDRGLFELPCGYFNELCAALERSAP